MMEPIQNRPGPCVLLADNDVAVNALLSGLLNDRGMRCESAHDGEAALQRLQRGGVDVLITDLDMPKLSGRELLARLAGLSSPPRTIVISGYVDATVERELRTVAAVRYVLRKPFDVLEFANLVRNLAAAD